MGYTKSQEDAIKKFRAQNDTGVPKNGVIQYYTPEQVDAVNRFRKENGIGSSKMFNPTYGEKHLSSVDKERLAERGRKMEDSLYEKK